MANRASSPFPTSHDTLGMSSIHTPMFLTSSPPRMMSPNQSVLPNGRFTPHSSRVSGPPRREQSAKRRSSGPSHSDTGSDSEAHLSDYTFDLDKLPTTTRIREKTAKADEAQDNDNLSEPGGPQDFTLNMVDLLRGPNIQNESNGEQQECKEDDLDDGPTRAAHDELSEIEPPLDMSTPAHILSRTTDLLSHENEQEKSELVGEIEQLRIDLRKKDEIIDANQRRVLDAASIVQQVRQLQAELQKQNERQISETASKDQRIQALEEQLQTKDLQLKQPQSKSVVREGQQDKELKDETQDTELRSLREQVEAKNQLLQQAKAKFDEAAVSYQFQLSQKVAENDRLRSEQHDNNRELDKLDSDIESLEHERDTLQKELLDLDKTVAHLTSQVARLQNDVSTAKAESSSKSNALEKMAERMSLDFSGKSFGQILELLNQTYQQDCNQARKAYEGISHEKQLAEIRVQLQESTSLCRTLSHQLESTQEDLSESQSALSVQQEENSRLSSQLKTMSSDQIELRQALEKMTQDRDEAIRMADKRHDWSVAQQLPSPSPSPPPTHSNPAHLEMLRRSHQQEVDRLENSHSTELSTLRNMHAESTRKLHTILRAAQEHESEIQSELTELRKLLASKSKELSAMAAENERLESVIEAKDTAATALDAKFASVLEKREEIWETRLEKLLRDRERMGKALLWTWGEREVGQQGRAGTQGYQYKYAKRPESSTS
ncbi:hypothetical protein LOZ64_000580 [Ophidiomyces ophidiicola]|nr:hypothetical protein LOZ64_000580 [Ophidiomyces ophidiicola]KAI2006123.1 hypothetical protein LOZ49_005167 [Ophidiomyces ophidiicola]KAI2026469.1 hypothetical protein LOZ46_000461 [Ophidiomyces ophidiicola]KAI2139295.1 hypothetical protein LOZ29_002462 [Ophidiomyces ophidiicola]KAI2147546.1 hypothetical protein LOZ28_000061 [Ophidiomyces ophidiicola]